MSVSEFDPWFYHGCLSAGTQTEPRADGPNGQNARRLLRTAAPDTRALVLGHKRSNCRVVLVSLKLNGKLFLPNLFVISGIASLST